MSERSPSLLIHDILNSGEKIIRYTAPLTLEAFIANEIITDAVIRNFEIIGEAANRLPEEFKNQNSHIDWFRIRGFRNRIVHDYAGVDLGIVWLIIKNFLPETIEKLRQLA